jgi:hypothetical protein
MAEAAGAALGAKEQASEVGEAVKEAVIAGCIALILFIGIVGIKTENAQGGLVLVYKLGSAVGLAVAVALIRLFFDLFVWRRLIGGNLTAKLMPSGLSSPAMLGAVALLYLFGAYFFLVPGARVEAGNDIADLFGGSERARTAVELLSMLFMSVFVVLTSMGIIFALRGGHRQALPGSASSSRRRCCSLRWFCRFWSPARSSVTRWIPPSRC